MVSYLIVGYASVAQLDRVTGYEPVGRGFESPRMCQKINRCLQRRYLFFCEGNMDYKKLLNLALTIGEKLLCSGAEVNRVEDSICRICKAYGAKHVDVFTITSSIVVTACFDENLITETRRIKRYNTDFKQFDYINNLSRMICEEKPDLNYVEQQLKIYSSFSEKKYKKYIAWFLVAGAFTMFFGGNLTDAVISAIIAVLARFILTVIEYVKLNNVIANIILSFMISSSAYIFSETDVYCNPDKIIIGNIMLLIPGIALTNAIKDLIIGDTMTGLLRFSEALLTSVAIAGGYFLTTLVFGGAI